MKYYYVPIILFMLIRKNVGEETDFDFFIKGEEIRIATKIREERISLIVGIDMDIVTTKQMELSMEEIIKKWEKYPPFQSDAALAQIYFGLTEDGVAKLVAVAKIIAQILAYKDDLSKYVPEYECTYNHSTLSMKTMQQDVKNMETAFNRIGTTWTANSIKTDNTEINTIRVFVQLFSETMDYWFSDFNKVLAELDTLASELYPSTLMGHYQEAPCIKNITGEKVQVLDCHRAKSAFICNIDVKIPEEINHMNILIPVHYDEIRIRGHNKDQIFALTDKNPEPKVLDCNHYDVHSVDVPICQILSIPDNCLSKLQGKIIWEVINKCNFTKDQADVGIRTESKGLLVQGTKVTTKVKDGTGYKILTTDTPVIVFTDQEVVLSSEGEEYKFTTVTNSSGTKVIKSRLVEKDIERLKARYGWEIFWEDFDYEDVIRYVILCLQIIMYPVVILSIGLGIRARKNLKQLGFSSQKKNPQKQIYKKNKALLKNVR